MINAEVFENWLSSNMDIESISIADLLSVWNEYKNYLFQEKNETYACISITVRKQVKIMIVCEKGTESAYFTNLEHNNDLMFANLLLYSKMPYKVVEYDGYSDKTKYHVLLG